MAAYIIRKIRLAHCKRGPERCAQCREMNVERYSLLDIDPPDPGRMQRRVIEVRVDGVSTWCEFDVVRSFTSQKEALAYAARHQIQDVEFEEAGN